MKSKYLGKEITVKGTPDITGILLDVELKESEGYNMDIKEDLSCEFKDVELNLLLQLTGDWATAKINCKRVPAYLSLDGLIEMKCITEIA